MATAPDHQYANDDQAELDALQRENEQARLREACDGIIARLSGLALDAVTARGPIEQRWLDNLRMYHGRHDEVTESALRATPEKSRGIINMTRPKTKAWAARLKDLLFPADDKNWGISPTPVPELDERAKQAAKEAAEKHAQAAALVDQANADQETGTVTGPGMAAALNQAEALGSAAMELEKAEADARAVMDEAKRRAEGMSKEIDDQLTQCQYPSHARRAIDDMCLLGPGVMKGPLNGKSASRWVQNGNVFELAPTRQGNSPVFLYVDPWAFFPDPNARTMEESEYEFERHLPNKSQLRKLAKRMGFYEAPVRELLVAGPGFGTATDIQIFTQIRAITGEGQAILNRYVLWEYHGPLEKSEVCTLLLATDGEDAAKAFEEEYDELDEIRVIVYFCDGKLLKIEPDWLLDSNETLFSVVSFDKTAGTVLGAAGVPEMMRDPAKAIAAAWRMLMDNSGLSVGPQVVIDKSKVEPENGSWKMEPRKVWKRSGDVTNEASKPFEIFNIPSNVNELVQTIELGLKFVDEVVSMPLIAQGEQGSHITQTMGGMSMLMNSANVIFRSVVKNFDDDMTTPNIRRLYDWNMQFNDKQEIKGDLQVEARGTSALLVREMQSQNLMIIAERWSSHPTLSLAVKVYDALRMAVSSLSINPDDILGTRDEFEAALKAQQENQPADPRIEAAKIDAQSRSETNQVSKEIAQLKKDEAVLQLMSAESMSREQIEAKLEERKREFDHQERMKAVDIAVEGQRAAEEKAEGGKPSDATGKEIG